MILEVYVSGYSPNRPSKYLQRLECGLPEFFSVNSNSHRGFSPVDKTYTKS